MGEENIIQEFRLKNLEEIKNYFIKEISQNELMSYIKHFVILVSKLLDVFQFLLLLLHLVLLCELRVLQ